MFSCHFSFLSKRVSIPICINPYDTKSLLKLQVWLTLKSTVRDEGFCPTLTRVPPPRIECLVLRNGRVRCMMTADTLVLFCHIFEMLGVADDCFFHHQVSERPIVSVVQEVNRCNVAMFIIDLRPVTSIIQLQCLFKYHRIFQTLDKQTKIPNTCDLLHYVNSDCSLLCKQERKSRCSACN